MSPSLLRLYWLIDLIWVYDTHIKEMRLKSTWWFWWCILQTFVVQVQEMLFFHPPSTSKTNNFLKNHSFHKLIDCCPKDSVHHIQNCFYDTLKCMKKVKKKKKKTRWKPRPLKSRQRAAVTAASEEAAAGGGDSSLGKREGKVTLSAPPAAVATWQSLRGWGSID